MKREEPQTIQMNTITYLDKTLARTLAAKYPDEIIPSDAPEIKGLEGIPEPPGCPHCGKRTPYIGTLTNYWIRWITSLQEACTCEKAQAEISKQEAEWAEQERETQERRKQKRIETLYEASGLTARNRRQTFDRWEPKEEKMRQIKQFIEAYKDMAVQGVLEKNDGLNSLFMHGPCGAGKTHLACAVANALIEAEKPVLMTTFGDLVQEIKSTFIKGAMTSEKDIVQKYRQAPMLIIDDLGKEKPTDWSASILFSILNHRYSDIKPTIITSNFSPDVTIRRIAPSEDEALCGRSIVSRIHEVYSIVNISTEDHRTYQN